MIEQNIPEQNEDEIDVDALLTSIEERGSGQDIPMTQPESEAPPAKAESPQVPAASTAAQEFEIAWNGKTIKAPVDKVKQWASQGYDYNQKMQEYNQLKQELEGRGKKYDSEYKPIDEYIAQNPQWWEHVQQAYQNREKMSQDNPLAQEIQSLKSQLKEVVEFKNTIAEEKAQVERVKEDEKLTTEIQSIREKFADLDWQGVDESGLSLEQRVLKHAIENDIKTFRAAFMDLNHETLLKKAEERGKEQVSKDIQKRNKLGLLGKSPAPTRHASNTESVKDKSYEQLMDEAIEEMGLTKRA